MQSFFAKLWTCLKEAWKRLRQSKIDKTPQVLCVDDDFDFCAYIAGLVSPLGMEIEKAYSMEQAKQKIEADSTYAAFIIDGHLPDGSGLELVAWIREKKKLGQPIIFLSRIYQDAASFRILKESLKVDYVLEKPVKADDLKRLLSELSPSRLVKESFPDALLDEARAHYQTTIFDKIDRLERIINSVQHNPSLENLQVFRMEVHKLAGSSGSYGYAKVSLLCKSLEMDLIRQIELAKESKHDVNWLNSLNQFFAQLKAGFQDFSLQENIPGISLSPPLSSFLSFYVVEDDPLMIENWQNVLKEKPNAQIGTDPQQALKKLALSDLSAQVIVVPAKFKQTPHLDGYKLLEIAQRNKALALTSFGLAIDLKDGQELSYAIKRGVSFIVTFPPTEKGLNFLMNQSLQQGAKYKILVVDDDLDTIQFLKDSLGVLGFNITILNDSLLLEQALMEAQPDILIADIDLSDPKKVEILLLLKKIPFKKLLVAMVTIKQESDLIKKIYGFTVDDILFKPLEANILQKHILSLLKKSFSFQKEEVENLLPAGGGTQVWMVESSSRHLEALNQLFEKIDKPVQMVSAHELLDKISFGQGVVCVCLGRSALEDAQAILHQFDTRKALKMQVIYISELVIDHLEEFFKRSLGAEENLYYLMLVIEN